MDYAAREHTAAELTDFQLSLDNAHIPISQARTLGGWTIRILCYLSIALLSLWSVLALFLDCRTHGVRLLSAVLYLLVVTSALVFFKRPLHRLLATTLCFAIVLAWWSSLAPSNEGDWQTDVSRLATADIKGSLVTFHNVRNCDYRAELDYTCQWVTRQISLDQVQGVDVLMNYWGSPWIAHTIVSFRLGPDPSRPAEKGVDPIVFSIETRKQVGQQYSSVLGFFRQYTLISVVSDERDVVRLRTNYRHGEDVYLYHTRATTEFARSLLLNYASFTNHLHDRPMWYNAVTHNCTTEIYTLQALKDRPKDWRILMNGKADEMLYDQNALAAQPPGQPPTARRLPFTELKSRAYINPAARAADQDPDFSERIRENRPGFGNAMSNP
jgi:Domain of unknown function (DUF4105)